MPSFAYAAYAHLCCSQEPAAWLEAQQGPASRRVTGSCTGMRTHTCTSPRACGAPARGVRWLQPWDTSKGLRASAQLCFALLLCLFPLSTRSTPHASPPLPRLLPQLGPAGVVGAAAHRCGQQRGRSHAVQQGCCGPAGHDACCAPRLVRSSSCSSMLGAPAGSRAGGGGLAMTAATLRCVHAHAPAGCAGTWCSCATVSRTTTTSR